MNADVFRAAKSGYRGSIIEDGKLGKDQEAVVGDISSGIFRIRCLVNHPPIVSPAVPDLSTDEDPSR